MKTAKIEFSDGNEVITDINGDVQEIFDYYLGIEFGFPCYEEGKDEYFATAIKVEVTDEAGLKYWSTHTVL